MDSVHIVSRKYVFSFWVKGKRGAGETHKYSETFALVRCSSRVAS